MNDKGRRGWVFDKDEKSKAMPELSFHDTVNNLPTLAAVYHKSAPDYNDKFTTPLLWDKKKNIIVNNESSEIIRMMIDEFSKLSTKVYGKINLYPKHLESEIKEIDKWLYNDV